MVFFNENNDNSLKIAIIKKFKEKKYSNSELELFEFSSFQLLSDFKLINLKNWTNHKVLYLTSSIWSFNINQISINIKVTINQSAHTYLGHLYVDKRIFRSKSHIHSFLQ